MSDWIGAVFYFVLFFLFFFEVTTVRDCFYLCALGEELFMLLLGPE